MTRIIVVFTWNTLNLLFSQGIFYVIMLKILLLSIITFDPTVPYQPYSEWCYTKSMKMEVKLRGCKTRMITNNYRLGNAIYIIYHMVCMQSKWLRVTWWYTVQWWTPTKTRRVKVKLDCWHSGDENSVFWRFIRYEW